jgi:hypothetical protein
MVWPAGSVMLIWTTQKPMKEGWYWFTNYKERTSVEVVEVKINGAGFLTESEPSAWVEGQDLIDATGEQWIGPLELPKE